MSAVRPPKAWATEGIDQPWNIGEAIGVAMPALRKNLASLLLPILGVNLLTFGVAAGSAFLRLRVLRSPGATDLALQVGALLFIIVAGAVNLALVAEAALGAVRGRPVPRGRLGRALRRAPAILAWQALFVLSVVLAAVPSVAIAAVCVALKAQSAWELLLVLPPLLVADGYVLLFIFTPLFIADGDSFPHAMTRCYRATNESLGTVFLYFVALLPLLLLAALPIVGLPFWVFFWLGLAYGYARATGRNDLPWLKPEFASLAVRRFLRITFLVLLAVGAGLGVRVVTLPALRGSAWSLTDTAFRASAIVVCVATIVVLMALLLPYVLDRLEGDRFTSYVAARHVRSQKSGFLTIISVLSIVGVAMSSCSLSSVVSVMEGFKQDLKRKILGNNAHIVIDTTPGTPFGDYEKILERVRPIKGVIGATPVVRGDVMASSASNLAGVTVNGVDPGSISSVIDLERNIEVGKMEYLVSPEKLTHLGANEIIGMGPGGEPYFKGPEAPGFPDDLDPAVKAVLIDKPYHPGIIVGRELAKTLHVYVGDEITLVSPLGDLGPMGVMPRTKKFRVAAIFYSGMYEYDATYVYTMLDAAQDYFQQPGQVGAIEIKVDDAEHVDRYTPEVEAAAARPELRVRNWDEINKSLFAALKLERFATFIILSVAILVASFCIVCTLLLMVTEKGKEIAILKALGASDRSILFIFMIEGIIIGAIGTGFGVVTGLATCTGLAWFGLRLDPEVYYIDRLPISVNGWDFLSVAVAAMVICTLSTLYPAWAASRLRPVDGLRYE